MALAFFPLKFFLFFYCYFPRPPRQPSRAQHSLPQLISYLYSGPPCAPPATTQSQIPSPGMLDENTDDDIPVEADGEQYSGRRDTKRCYMNAFQIKLRHRIRLLYSRLWLVWSQGYTPVRLCRAVLGDDGWNLRYRTPSRRTSSMTIKGANSIDETAKFPYFKWAGIGGSCWSGGSFLTATSRSGISE